MQSIEDWQARLWFQVKKANCRDKESAKITAANSESGIFLVGGFPNVSQDDGVLVCDVEMGEELPAL